MLQKGEQSDDPKPTFAPLPSGEKIESVTLEQALEMFTLPRVVGATESGEEIKANIGRFGPYIQVGKTYVSIKPDDPFTITESRARELYAEKLQKDKEKFINVWGDVQVLNGRYGPYVTDGNKNVKVPKDTDPKSITEAEAKEMLDKAPAGKGRFKRKAVAKASTKPAAKKPAKKKSSTKKA